MSLFNQDQIDRVSTGFSGLSAGKKAVLGAITVAAIAGGVWWSRLPGPTRMEPVLDQPMEATQLAQIGAHLKSKQVPFQADGSRILVSSDVKLDVLADLAYEDLLPTNTESGFDQMIKKGGSIWDTSTKIDRMYLMDKQHRLETVIGRFPGVKKATVVIDPTSQQSINVSVTPTAWIDIQTRGAGAVKNTRQLVLAAVNAVTGAQSNLSREKVQVTIDGAPCRVGDEREMFASSELLERVQQHEQNCVAKVRKQLAFIPDALITVSVEMADVEPAAAAARAASATQPSAALVANTGRRITVAPAASASAAAAWREPEAMSVLSASVAVPRSYFVRIYQRANPKITEPSDGILQPIIDAELDKIRKLVKACLAIREEDDVTVESYYDFSSMATVTTPAIETAINPLASLWGNRTSQIAIGATGLIALISLPLLLLRRKAPQPALVSSRPIHSALLNPQHVEDFEEDYQANDDDNAFGPAQIPRHLQLEDLGTDDPDAAADVVERWIAEK